MIIYPQKLGLKFTRTALYDTITEAHICKTIEGEFGRRYLRGSSVINEHKVSDQEYKIICAEHKFRDQIKDRDINNVVEIGTNLGVGSLLLAHYAYHLTTIDIFPRTEPLPLWDYFGMSPKITYAVAQNDESKKDFISTLDFDFACIDGDHTYDGVKLDFEAVKKCGRVLICGYDIHKGVTKFVNELPKNETEKTFRFVYWEKR